MIAQHRKKECCTSEEGKLKNKIMFAEILFFGNPSFYSYSWLLVITTGNKYVNAEKLQTNY